MGYPSANRGWMIVRPLSALVLLMVMPAAVTSQAAGEAPRALAPGELPDDHRLGDLKDLNGYFPFHPCPTREAWEARSERLQRQLRVATGLWPMPTKTPTNAVIHGKIDRGDYTVEKVYLESFPGHFVTGNLYRPKGRSGKLPAVLCPHGHWPNGRFHDAGEKKVRWDIVHGAERFERGGRHPIQARCAQLARMGCVVLNYDMVGYADSVQLGHRPGFRESMNTEENWGYFSPQAEARMQNMMGLQTYNSVRALDWLLGLPGVDPQRVAVTGASGGGTQTFILCALDPRPAVAFPAVMVSTAMQGGCTCENACYLRISTGNIEIAALISPRPLGMTAADDWTREIATKGLPELKQHYKMLGVEALVMAEPLVHFKHNYNYVSRAVMYHWLNKHLKLGLEEPIVEERYEPLAVEEMTVWDDDHPKPPSGDDYERSLLRWITEDSQKQMAALVDGLQRNGAQALAEYRRIVGGAVDVMIGRHVPEAGRLEARGKAEQDRGAYRQITLLACCPERQEQVPAVALVPPSYEGRAVVWIDKHGKRSLFGQGHEPKATVGKLLHAGIAVVGVDLFGQGEFTEDGKPLQKQRLNDSGRGQWKRYAGYTYGYNYPMFSKRVHDVLTAVALARHWPELAAQHVDLVGLHGAGHWVAAARAQAGSAVDRAVIDTGGFRFADVEAIDDADFLPGGAKYLDLPGMIALSAPHAVWLAGEQGQAAHIITAAYAAAEAPQKLTLFEGEKETLESAAVDWLLRSTPGQ